MLTIPPFVIGCATGAVAGALGGTIAARRAVRDELAAFEMRQRIEAAKRADAQAEAAAPPQPVAPAVVEVHVNQPAPIAEVEVQPAKGGTGQFKVTRQAQAEDWENTGNIRVQPIAKSEKPAPAKAVKPVKAAPKPKKHNEPAGEMPVVAARKHHAGRAAVDAYEEIAENYVEKMTFRELMATRARGVAAVLADRLGGGADSIPVIERADGSTGDIGAPWWADALNTAARPKTVVGKNVRTLDEFGMAPVAPAEPKAAPAPVEQVQAPAPVFMDDFELDELDEDTTNSLRLPAMDDLHFGDTSGAMPVLEQTGSIPTTGSIVIPRHAENIGAHAKHAAPAPAHGRTAELESTNELEVSNVDDLTPELAAQVRVSRMSSASVEDIIAQMMAEERQALGLDEQRSAQALEAGAQARREREAQEKRLANVASAASLLAEERQAMGMDETRAVMALDAGAQARRERADQEALYSYSHALVEERASEVMFPEVRDDTDPGMHVDIWKLALDALEERTSTDLRDQTFAFMDAAGDADSIDDPEGLEASTAFLSFRRPAGHPEIMDTSSYINYLIENEFGQNPSRTVQERSREYLKVIEGGSNKAQPLVDPRAKRSPRFRHNDMTEAQEA